MRDFLTGDCVKGGICHRFVILSKHSKMLQISLITLSWSCKGRLYLHDCILYFWFNYTSNADDHSLRSLYTKLFTQLKTMLPDASMSIKNIWAQVSMQYRFFCSTKYTTLTSFPPPSQEKHQSFQKTTHSWTPHFSRWCSLQPADDAL